MSKTRITNAAVADQAPESQEPAAEAVAVLHSINLQSTIGKHMQRLLAPYVSHGPECPAADECTCGLTAALAELARTEVMALRYGS